MKISILLPYKENFSPLYPGAVSLFINSMNKLSNYKNQITVYGSTDLNEKFSNNYVNIELKKSFLKSQTRDYVNKFVQLHQNNNVDIIEIHNRPNYIEFLSSLNTKKVLYFHNDPISMIGSKTSNERKELIRNCAKIIFNSEWSKKQFLKKLDKFYHKSEKLEVIHQSINKEEGNEFYYSDLVANDLKTLHEKYSVTSLDLLNILDDVIMSMSEPMFSQDSSAFYLLAQNVSKSAKVVLSGQGADEVFGGYFWYEKIMSEKELSGIDTLIKYYFDRSYDNYKTIIHSDYISENYASNDIESRLKHMDPSLSILDKVFRLELSMFIIDDPVKRVDNMTMSHSLEARVPFLDIDLVSFMLSVSGEDKIENGEKFLLKEISKRYLSNKIINREKFYFPVPPLKIIKDKFFDYCRETLLTESALERNLYNPSYINKILKKPNQHFTNLNGNELWHFTLLERWFQLNIDH